MMMVNSIMNSQIYSLCMKICFKIGFGFTDRPEISNKNSKIYGNVNPYSFTASSGIGNSLLHNIVAKSGENDDDFADSNMNEDESKGIWNQLKNKKIVLFGHSMGSITTLKMALQIPPSTQKTIVLVSPAILYSKSLDMKKEKGYQKKSLSTLFQSNNLFVNAIARKVNSVLYQLIIKPAQILLALAMKIFVDVPFQYILKRLVR